MLPENSTQTTKQIESRREFISEAFHTFNQPLTAMHCGLELCLLKERSEEEYRQRIEDALAHAGTVLQLSKAVRELAEAADPGEDLQNVELQPVLSALGEDLAVIAEAAVVALKLTCSNDVVVRADPGKLARHIGNLASILMRALEPGGNVGICAEREGKDILIVLSGVGRQRLPVEDGVQTKLDGIRVDAASSYLWTLGGDFHKDRSSFTIRLQALQ